MNFLMEFLKNEDGVTAIEYALIAALIAVAIIVAVRLTGIEVGNVFNDVRTAMENAGS